MSEVEIQERHLEIAQRVARIDYSSKRDQCQKLGIIYEDLFSEAIFALFIASKNWLGGSTFETHAWFSADRRIKRYIQKEQWRYAIVKFFSYNVELDSDEKERTLLNTLEDPKNVEDLVQTRLFISSILDALKLEKPVVKDTILRILPDTDIAKKYNLLDSNSIRQYRKRFFRDFLDSYEDGKKYKSNGRNRNRA